jgi:enoyl-CoA hydratase/carnithine racemase
MSEGTSALDQHEGRGRFAQLFEDLWSLGKPTIARVRGYALGGGFGLALACDLVVAAQDARFGTPELDVGLWPFVVTVPLTRSMPPKTALELMLTGRRVTAEEGQRIGFVHRVVGADHLDASVHELAATLVSKPPGVLRLGRDSFYAEWDRSTEEALGRLHQLLRLAARSPEATEGLRAFKEHRRPSWPPPG